MSAPTICAGCGHNSGASKGLSTPCTHPRNPLGGFMVTPQGTACLLPGAPLTPLKQAQPKGPQPCPN